jgi:peptidoglycan L-alanyl-D-glutamate endopeptidase CwlK
MPTKFKLSKRSQLAMNGVHPDLIGVVSRAIELTEVDFVVTEGVRTPERQAKLKEAGASWTLNGRHLVGADGYGKAVDLAAWFDGRVDYSWPLYYKLADAMKQAAKELGVAIVWGGDWKKKDGPHFELDRKVYP